jgi:hypothetical protein
VRAFAEKLYTNDGPIKDGYLYPLLEADGLYLQLRPGTCWHNTLAREIISSGSGNSAFIDHKTANETEPAEKIATRVQWPQRRP